MSKTQKKKVETILEELQLSPISDPKDGGNARVYICRNQKGEEVALKYLRSQKEEAIIRFKREIMFLNSVDRNLKIIPLIDTDKESWYTMPVAQPIMEYTKAKSAIEILELFIPLCATLMSLHAQGISHRDIKPDNIYWYNGSCCLGDFGLYKDEHNPGNLTTDERGVGALFTVAPEMQRYPKEADPYKGDVYSMAKTLWMLLTREEKGFDGTYDGAKDKVGFRFFGHLANEYLAGIEMLLGMSTKTDPEERPDIAYFLSNLLKVIDIQKYPGAAQTMEWKYIRDLVSPSQNIRTIVWTDLDEIVRVLNFVGRAKAANHMMYATGGGLDFSRIERSAEKGCLKMYMAQSMFAQVVRPKALYYECFQKTNWNYFILELEKQSPLFYTDEREEEDVLEESPGVYVPLGDAVPYGVYDYDKGNRIPENVEVVTRVLQGRMLIITKASPYNYLIDTYDGRHGNCSVTEFRDYMDDGYKNGFENVDCPFIPRTESYEEQEAEYFEKIQETEKIIRENYSKWIIPIVKSRNKDDVVAEYCVEFVLPQQCMILSMTQEKMYLGADGRLTCTDMRSCHKLYNRDDAEQQCRVLIQYVRENLSAHTEYPYEHCVQLHIRRMKANPPSFTRKEVISLMRQADDRRGNQIVVDELGKIHMIHPLKDRWNAYPFKCHVFSARHNECGPYADYMHCTIYEELLSGWLEYLRTERECHHTVFVETEAICRKAIEAYCG